MRSKLLKLALLLSAAALAAAGMHASGLVDIPAWLLKGSRLAAIVGLAAAAARRRSLTTWILIGMITGVEIGYDWPALAVDLRVLSQIFLRLIRTIIAPLLFGTLVVGIAGQSNLKQVGRMGVKALIYFEVVTTLALLIGLAAINISKAGVDKDIVGDGSRNAQLVAIEVS